METSEYVLFVRTLDELTHAESTSTRIWLKQSCLTHVSHQPLAKGHLKYLYRALKRALPNHEMATISCELDVGCVTRAQRHPVQTVPVAGGITRCTVNAKHIGSSIGCYTICDHLICAFLYYGKCAIATLRRGEVNTGPVAMLRAANVLHRLIDKVPDRQPELQI